MIFVTNSDGTGAATPLTTAGATFSTEPAWSPDGTKIAFKLSVERFPGNYELSDIWTMNADGTGKVNLAGHPRRERSAAELVARRLEDRVRVRCGRDRGDGRRGGAGRLTRGLSGVVAGPGTRVLYTDSTELLTVDPDGTDPTVVRPASTARKPGVPRLAAAACALPAPKGRDAAARASGACACAVHRAQPRARAAAGIRFVQSPGCRVRAADHGHARPQRRGRRDVGVRAL